MSAKPHPKPHTVRPAIAPKQKRSQITLDKILTATEKLLETAEFEEITIEQIARTAGVAVGTVYTRFANKDDLLPFLISRLQDEQLKIAPELSKAIQYEGISLEDRVKFQIQGSASQMNSERKGLIKALVRRFLLEGHKIPDEEIEKGKRLQGYLRDWLLQCRDEIEHPNPDLAVRMATHLMTSPLQIKLFFLESRSDDLSVDEFIDELNRAVIGYLKPSALHVSQGD